jgi:hypothetical protein
MSNRYSRSVEFIDWVRGDEDVAAVRRYREVTSPIDARGGNAEPYRGSLFLDEVQVWWDGRWVGAVLSLAAAYICARLCDVSSELLEAAVPHRYVYGTPYGRVEERYQRLDAGGQEGVVEELERRIWRYEEERVDLLLKCWDRQAHGCVYLVEEPDMGAGTIHAVLSDRAALRRGRAGVAEYRAIERPVAELEEAVAEEKELLARYIEAQKGEVVGSCWNRVRRLTSRRRIVVRKEWDTSITTPAHGREA